jgi:hypothetical protein
MTTAIYSTTSQEGIDINSVFQLSTATPEYPRPPFIPGELAWGTDGSEWVYCTASVTIGAGAVVFVSPVPGSWSVALIGGATVGSALLGELVGVVGGSTGTMVVPAPSGSVTGTYFWVQRAGNCPNVQTAASTTKNAQLYDVAATAGIVFTTTPGTGSGYQIAGMVISQATGSTAGPNTAILNYPTIGVAT